MPADDLSGAVLDDVLEVEQRPVDPRPTADDVALAVADGDPVVAGPAPDRVAGEVVGAVDVFSREGPQPVVAVAALRVGKARPRPPPAVRAVVARAAGEQVRAVPAARHVGARPGPQPVRAGSAVESVGARPGVEAVVVVGAGEHIVAGT